MKEYIRPHADVLRSRLGEPRRFIQIVLGARQVGKTTLVNQVMSARAGKQIMVNADDLRGDDRGWLVSHWERARRLAGDGEGPVVFVVDEILKVHEWSDTVKRLWDEDTRTGRDVRVVLLGSAPLLLHRGLNESLAGRFELVRLPHWSFTEMKECFGLELEEFLFFGGYPGAAPLRDSPERWRRYVLDALIEPTVGRDILQMARVDKPALLRRVFELGALHSGQVLSWTKMVGQLQEAGNTTTLAHYLELLGSAGMLMGIQKYAGSVVRQRGSSPKFQVMNNALLTSLSGRSPDEARHDPELRGRVVESAVGAHLANAAAVGDCELFWWARGDREVDFVVTKGAVVVAIEVKSVERERGLPGLAAFEKEFPVTRSLVVGGRGIPVDEFLSTPVSVWLRPM